MAFDGYTLDPDGEHMKATSSIVNTMRDYHDDDDRRPANPEDAGSIAVNYNEGIADRVGPLRRARGALGSRR